jgi:HSP20 family molecular chaperone IbpA
LRLSQGHGNGQRVRDQGGPAGREERGRQGGTPRWRALTIEGERQQEKRRRARNSTRSNKIEREYGKFLRRFALPNEGDPSKVQAEFKNGVLNVHLPKSATAKPRRSTSR